MGKINFARVLLGGLVAGLILNIGEVLLNDMVLGAQMKAFFAEHKFTEPGTNFMIVAVVLTFLLGIVIVFGYAAIRPRFGAGVKTAIIAGLFAWFGVYCYSGTIDGMLFGIPMNAMLMVCAWGLVEYILAAIAGAALYKES
ncbi:MAG: hypothetical protein QOE77_1323 [Blastocatellia bacterium]|jgi:hypothetical protein|nr:hypothetical protein [Blastocatellia bacterium]